MNTMVSQHVGMYCVYVTGSGERDKFAKHKVLPYRQLSKLIIKYSSFFFYFLLFIYFLFIYFFYLVITVCFLSHLGKV